MIRAAGKRFIPKRFIDYFESPYPKQVAVAKALARAEKGATVRDLEELTGVSEGTIRDVIRQLRAIKSIHVCGWQSSREKGVSAVYGLGDKQDAPRPTPKHVSVAANKKEQAFREQQEKDSACAASKHYLDLSMALAPPRSNEQQQAANERYLDWLRAQASG